MNKQFLNDLFDIVSIKRDKANHFIYGLIFFIFFKLLLFSNLNSFIFVSIIALLKEILDVYLKKLNIKEFLLDFIWTILGAIIGLICLYI